MSLKDRLSQPSKEASCVQLGSVGQSLDWMETLARTAHTPGRPQEPGPSQEQGARNQELDPLGVDWGGK